MIGSPGVGDAFSAQVVLVAVCAVELYLMVK